MEREIMGVANREICHTAHWNIVAKRIRLRYDLEANYYIREALADLAIDFAKWFAADNPRFDPMIFLEACSPNNILYPLTELWEGGSN